MSYPLLDVFWTMFWFFLWILWIFLVVRIILDVFRSDDLGGWAKAGWAALIVIVPLVGVLIYLIARGGSMRERQMREAEAADAAFRQRIREAAGTGAGTSTASELSKLSDLHDRGVLTDAEFTREKEKILSLPPRSPVASRRPGHTPSAVPGPRKPPRSGQAVRPGRPPAYSFSGRPSASMISGAAATTLGPPT